MSNIRLFCLWKKCLWLRSLNFSECVLKHSTNVGCTSQNEAPNHSTTIYTTSAFKYSFREITTADTRTSMLVKCLEEVWIKAPVCLKCNRLLYLILLFVISQHRLKRSRILTRYGYRKAEFFHKSILSL